MLKILNFSLMFVLSGSPFYAHATSNPFQFFLGKYKVISASSSQDSFCNSLNIQNAKFFTIEQNKLANLENDFILQVTSDLGVVQIIEDTKSEGEISKIITNDFESIVGDNNEALFHTEIYRYESDKDAEILKQNRNTVSKRVDLTIKREQKDLLLSLSVQNKLKTPEQQVLNSKQCTFQAVLTVQ